MNAPAAGSRVRAAPWQPGRAASLLPIVTGVLAEPPARRQRRSTPRLERMVGLAQLAPALQPEAEVTNDIEALILERCVRQIAQEAGPGASVVELGSGTCRNTLRLLAALEAPAGYRVIDRSRDALTGAMAAIRARFPTLPLAALVSDFATVDAASLMSSRELVPGRKLIFIPGSRIGRLAPHAATALLHRLAAFTARDALLVVGADALCRSPGPTPVAGEQVRPDCNEPTPPARGHSYSLPRFEALIGATGWQHAQFWTDGAARFGVHVLARV